VPKLTPEMMGRISTELANDPKPDSIMAQARKLRNLSDTHGSKL
jgi:hypothetical protein